MIKFQNFSIGVCILGFCSSISFFFFKHEVSDIYIEFFLWWVATFLLFLISLVPLQTIDFPHWIIIQSCFRPSRICLNPHLDSMLIVDNSSHVVFLPPYPPPYATPYIFPYPPPYLPSYPTPSTSSCSSFILIPIPRTATINVIAHYHD